MLLRLIQLHLTLMHSKDESQGHSHLDGGDLTNDDTWGNVTISIKHELGVQYCVTNRLA